MSSEQFSRALMEVGSGLGEMAQYSAQKERDQANHVREQSLMRLRQRHAETMQGNKITADNERAETNRKHDVELSQAQMAHREKLAEGSNAVQSDRIRKQELRNVEATGVAAIKGIDMRIADLEDQLNEAALGDEGMGLSEEAQLAKAGIQAKIEDLRFERVNANYAMMLKLKAHGDPSYKDLDEEKLALRAGYTPDQIKAAKAQIGGGTPDPKGTPKRSQAEWEKRWEKMKEAGVGKDIMPTESAPPAITPTEVDNKGVESSTEPPQSRATIAEIMDSRVIRDDDGNPAFPSNKDATLMKFGRWLMSDSTNLLGSSKEDIEKELMAQHPGQR